MKRTIQKVALFGTSADPPSDGHKKIIEELSKIYKLVISYASDNPYKKHSEDLYFRSLLLKTLINDFNNSKISFDQDLSSRWAISSIRKCKNKYNLTQAMQAARESFKEDIDNNFDFITINRIKVNTT